MSTFRFCYNLHIPKREERPRVELGKIWENFWRKNSFSVLLTSWKNSNKLLAIGVSDFYFICLALLRCVVDPIIAASCRVSLLPAEIPSSQPFVGCHCSPWRSHHRGLLQGVAAPTGWGLRGLADGEINQEKGGRRTWCEIYCGGGIFWWDFWRIEALRGCEKMGKIWTQRLWEMKERRLKKFEVMVRNRVKKGCFFGESMTWTTVMF